MTMTKQETAAVQAESHTTVWTEDGAAGAETEIVVQDYPPTGETTMRAWSDDPDDERLKAPDPLPSVPQSWRATWGLAAVVVAIAGVVAFVIGIVGWASSHHGDGAPMLPPDPPAPYAGPDVPMSTAPAYTPPPPAQPSAPVFSGRYTMAQSWNGHTYTEMWDVTPCGDGCVHITVEGRPVTVGASLVGSQWTWTTHANAKCGDGTIVPDAGESRWTIDAVTLRGTSSINWVKPSCGQPGSGTDSNAIVLTRAD